MSAEVEEEVEDQTEVQLQDHEDRMSISMDNCLEISEITEEEAAAIRMSMQNAHETYQLSKEELEILEQQEPESEEDDFEEENEDREAVKKLGDDGEMDDDVELDDLQSELLSLPKPDEGS